MQKMRQESQAVTIYALVGIAVGLGAMWLSTALIFALGILVVAGLSKILKLKVFKEKDWRWLAGNGIWPYLATWYATWVVVLNLASPIVSAVVPA